MLTKTEKTKIKKLIQKKSHNLEDGLSYKMTELIEDAGIYDDDARDYALLMFYLKKCPRR